MEQKWANNFGKSDGEWEEESGWLFTMIVPALYKPSLNLLAQRLRHCQLTGSIACVLWIPYDRETTISFAFSAWKHVRVDQCPWATKQKKSFRAYNPILPKYVIPHSTFRLYIYLALKIISKMWARCSSVSVHSLAPLPILKLQTEGNYWCFCINYCMWYSSQNSPGSDSLPWVCLMPSNSVHTISLLLSPCLCLKRPSIELCYSLACVFVFGRAHGRTDQSGNQTGIQFCIQVCIPVSLPGSPLTKYCSVTKRESRSLEC